MPLLGVTITIENDAAMLIHDLLESPLNRLIEVCGTFEFARHPVERIGQNGVHRGERTGDGCIGAHRTELEPIASESKGGRAVAVSCVLG